MEPAERKKRILIGIASAVIALAFLGNFFWSFFKDFFHAQPNGGHASKTPLFIVGGFFLVMALAVVITVANAIRKISKGTTAAVPPRDPQPWLKRADWTAGKIKSTATTPVKFFILWAVLALALSAPAIWHIPQEWQKGNRAILVALIFPAAAFYLIGYTVVQWRSRRRFGDCFFELAQIPAPLGGSLDGQILVGSRLQLEHGLHLKISCIRRTVSGSGINRNLREAVLWQDEKIFRPDSALPEPEPGRSGIPVFFKLPANQPECFAHGNEAVVWRLEAKAKMSGPDFSALFEVPVFQVAGAVVAETAAEETDPTAALQESVEDVRRDEKSPITVTDGPDGRTFYFPAARNPGMAVMLTLFFAVWSGFLWLMIVKHAPVMFPVVFGLIDVVLFWSLLNVWFKSSRVTVDRDGVTAVNRWLLFSRPRRFAADGIAEFITQPGMQSGSQIYWAVKLVMRVAGQSFAADQAKYRQTGELPSVKMQIREASRGTALASGIASKPEADWLAREMAKTLGR